MIKISVIIPVYNVEKYLRQCLDSVINQTYKNLEIICVDDCSTDNSLKILHEYSQKDSRIKVLHNEVNSKLGPTRNHGMQYATGKYIHFLDSDDWLELDAYEKLVKVIEDNGDVDLIYFGHKCISELTKNVNEYSFDKNNDLNKIINIDDDYRAKMEWCEPVWNKLYSKAFLEEFHILSNDYECHEDMEYSLLIRINARTIYYLGECLINYRIQRVGSLMDNRCKYVDCVLKSYLNAEKLCKALNPKVGKPILVYEYMLLYNHSSYAYKNKLISYTKLREILKQADFSYLEDYIWSVILLRSLEIISQPEWWYLLKTMLREFTSKHCIYIYNLIVWVRKPFIKKLKSEKHNKW